MFLDVINKIKACSTFVPNHTSKAKDLKFQASSDVDLGGSKSMICHLSPPSMVDAVAYPAALLFAQEVYF